MNEIELRDVSFSYEGANKQAISNVTFLIRRGETVAIVGASGAGKSTVVDLILQLYLPSSGKIMVDGVDLASLDIKDWRRSVGVVDPWLAGELVFLAASDQGPVGGGLPGRGARCAGLWPFRQARGDRGL